MSQGEAPVLYGKYQLLSRLAVGGMAEVFKAKSHGVEGFEKILVIKRILPELSQNPRFVDMFIAEAKIAVTLSHANIVQVFDLGRAEERYFIAMEYVAGNDLATVLRRGRQLRRPIAQELAVFVVSEIAKGLDYAHRRRDSAMRPLGIVHRDVSPANVLVSWEGEVKLTDFGIAKAMGTVEEEGVVKGKYAYMSPEQARGEPVDGRADLFALGVVLYETLTGVSPFDSDSAYESLRRLRAGDVKPLRSLAPDVPAELASIVERAMSSRPADRQANAGRLYEELVQFLYSSGRRVSGHDLARYVGELRSARETASSGDDARLLAVFDAEADAEASRARTPVEVPRSVRPGEIGRPGRRGGTGVRPAVERRDTTLVAVAASGTGAVREGTVERLAARHGGVILGGALGSGVSVVFGARDPDGRDTETAARFALRLLRAVDAPRAGSTASASRVLLRVGIDIGRIQVGIDGDPVVDHSLEEMRARTLELAERAAGAQILVSAAAQRALGAAFSTLPLAAEPGAPHHLVEETAAQSSAGRLVGRREELKIVGELLAIANRGRLKVIGLAGDPGIGKTRFALETRRRLRLGGHDVGFHVASCSRQGRQVPLSAMAELLRAILALDEHDSDDTVRDRVVRLRELGLAPQEIGTVAAVLGAVGDGAEPSAPLLRPAVTRIVARLATDRLTVLCFDGAESMDEESLAIVDSLVRELRGARVAIVVAFRPGFVHPWRDDPAYQEITLRPLDDDDVARLAALRLSAEEVPLELLRDLTQKSGGNPLFVEEFLKALVEAGALDVTEGRVTYRPDVAAVEVPKTLRGMITSRLARLRALDREILQIAAIAGGRIGAEVVGVLTEEAPGAIADALRALEERALIIRQGTSDFVLASEVAADVLREGLTLESRRQLHAALAQALEALYPQRLDELAERLATHWREAGDRMKSVEHLVRAGERLATEQAALAAAQSFERAIALLGQMAVPDRERMLALYLRVGEVCWKGRKVQGERYMEAAIELAEALGRRDYLARFSLLRGRFLVIMHRVDEGQRWLERAKELARVLDDKALVRDVLLGTAESIVKLGMHRQAIQSLRQALALSEEARDLDVQLRCLTNLALTHATGGEPETGLAYVERARALLSQRPDRFTECELFKMESLVCFFGHRWEAGIEAARRGLELAKEYDFPYEAAVNAHNMGECYVRTGDYKAAFASFRYSYELSRDNGIDHLVDVNLRMLGFIDAFRFGSAEGRLHVVESIRKAEARGNVWDNVQARFLLAMIEQQRGEVTEAETILREALRVASENGYASYVSECEAGLRALREGTPIQRLS